MNQIKALKIQDNSIHTLLFAAVGTASLQHGLEARTVCGRSGDTLLKNKPTLKQLVSRLSLLFIRLVFYCTVSCDMRSEGSYRYVIDLPNMYVYRTPCTQLLM